MSSPKFTNLFPRYPTPNSLHHNYSSAKQHLNHSSSMSQEEKSTDLSQTSQQIQKINQRISELQQILNHQCSFCDSLMPVLHLYDYGMSITRYEQMIKSMNKSIALIGQEIKLEGGKQMGNGLRSRRQVNEIYLYDNRMEDNMGDSQEEINQRIERLGQKIRGLSTNWINNKNKQIENRIVERNEKQPEIFVEFLEQFRNKSTKTVAQFRNKLLLQESKMLLKNCQEPSHLTSQNQQIASSFIQQHLHQNIYKHQKQQTAALKLDASFLNQHLTSSTKKILNKQVSIIEILEKTEQFHNFNYNRIGEELVELNRQMQALLGQQLQASKYSKKQEIRSKENKKMCETLELLKIKMKLLNWQIKGLAKKEYTELTSCFNILGEAREQILRNYSSKDRQEKNNGHTSLYEELINFPVGGQTKQKDDRSFSAQLEKQLEVLENSEYQVQKFETLFSKDIQTLQDIYETVKNKHETLSEEMQEQTLVADEQIKFDKESSPNVSKGPSDSAAPQSIIISQSLHKLQQTHHKLAKSRRKLQICSTTQLKLTSPKNNGTRRDESFRMCSEFSPPIYLGRSSSKKEIRIEREEQKMESSLKNNKERKIKLNIHSTASLVPKKEFKKC